jgi:CRP-like cAMP-binding protein
MLSGKIAPLDRIGWLAHEDQAFREWVADVGRWRVYSAGQSIYSAEDPPDGLYGLASGSLEVTFPLIADEPVFLHLAEVGFWIGDVAELAEVPRLVSLGASSRSRLLHIPSRSVHALLASRPDYWRAFYRLSSINFRITLGLYGEALSLSVRARVCRLLLRMAETPQTLEITQDELARLVGVARGTLRRCLADLVTLGAIDTKYRRLRVLDPVILARFRNEQ